MDRLTPERRSANMRAIRSGGMKPELLVRRLVHALGYRFRLHRKDLPGKPDLALIARRKVIFVHGCFWHQHPGCREGRPPRTNQSYWEPKLKRNIERDRQAAQSLNEQGWKSLVIWECETTDETALRERLNSFLGHSQGSSKASLSALDPQDDRSDCAPPRSNDKAVTE
jgi:DNA mismatch endonuclease, patch repair protein